MSPPVVYPDVVSRRGVPVSFQGPRRRSAANLRTIIRNEALKVPGRCYWTGSRQNRKPGKDETDEEIETPVAVMPKVIIQIVEGMGLRNTPIRKMLLQKSWDVCLRNFPIPPVLLADVSSGTHREWIDHRSRGPGDGQNGNQTVRALSFSFAVGRAQFAGLRREVFGKVLARGLVAVR